MAARADSSRPEHWYGTIREPVEPPGWCCKDWSPSAVATAFRWPPDWLWRWVLPFRNPEWAGRRGRHDGRIGSAARLPGETPHPGADSFETCQNWSRLVKATRHRQEQHPPQISELLLTMNPRLCKE